MIIRRFREDDAEKVSAMIIHTLNTSNSKDYSAEDINILEKQFHPARMSGQRDGRKIIETLEQDESFFYSLAPL